MAKLRAGASSDAWTACSSREFAWKARRARTPTKYTKYYISSGGRANGLRGDGTLSTTAPAGAGQDTFTYDPASPVPSFGGNVCCSSVPSGPWDQRSAEERDDVLVCSTPPLSGAIEVTGPIVMKLFAATTAKDTDWTAKLVDVHPNGYAQNVQDGIVRARYRNGAGKTGALLDPGKVYEYTSTCGPRATPSFRVIAFVSRFRAATFPGSTGT